MGADVARSRRRETVIRWSRYLSGMGVLQDRQCITGIRHDYDEVYGGMKRCRNCWTVVET